MKVRTGGIPRAAYIAYNLILRHRCSSDCTQLAHMRITRLVTISMIQKNTVPITVIPAGILHSAPVCGYDSFAINVSARYIDSTMSSFTKITGEIRIARHGPKKTSCTGQSSGTYISQTSAANAILPKLFLQLRDRFLVFRYLRT